MRMQRVGRIRIYRLIFILFWTFYSGITSGDNSISEQLHQEELENWPAEHYSEVLQMVLPPMEIDRKQFAREIKWAVSVRILPTFASQREVQFTVYKSYSGVAKAVITAPIEGSIQAQVKDLKLAHEDLNAKSISALIKISKSQITDKDCQALGGLTKKLEGLKFSSVLGYTIYVDPTLYEIWSGAREGSMHFQIVGEHPYIEWAEQAQELLESCGPK